MIARFERVATGWWLQLATNTMRYNRNGPSPRDYLFTREEMLDLRRQIDQALAGGDEGLTTGEPLLVACRWEDNPDAIEGAEARRLVPLVAPAGLPVPIAHVFNGPGGWAWVVAGTVGGYVPTQAQAMAAAQLHLGAARAEQPWAAVSPEELKMPPEEPKSARPLTVADRAPQVGDVVAEKSGRGLRYRINRVDLNGAYVEGRAQGESGATGGALWLWSDYTYVSRADGGPVTVEEG